MIVVDASVLANAIGDDGSDGRRARHALRSAGALSAPDLVDVETVAVLRKRWIEGSMTEERFSAAIDDLAAIDLVRYPTGPLMRRAFELKTNLSAHDAAYVAIAEGLECPLLTADERLARAPGIACEVSLLTRA